MINHSQTTQSNKFAISLQYLRKEVRNGSHFWHVDKSQSFSSCIIPFDGSGQIGSKYPKQEVSKIFVIY